MVVDPSGYSRNTCMRCLTALPHCVCCGQVCHTREPVGLCAGELRHELDKCVAEKARLREHNEKLSHFRDEVRLVMRGNSLANVPDWRVVEQIKQHAAIARQGDVAAREVEAQSAEVKHFMYRLEDIRNRITVEEDKYVWV